ncbi:MAG: thioredoxin domain-containing protein [Nanoarchaeota archaeon]
MVKKNNYITLIIIIAIIILTYFIIQRDEPTTSEETAKCIGQNSVLYVQLGCIHCKEQEDMFGNNTKYLNMIDCFYEKEKCKEIMATPTWIIKGEKYDGLQSIEKLKELTDC